MSIEVTDRIAIGKTVKFSHGFYANSFKIVVRSQRMPSSEERREERKGRHIQLKVEAEARRAHKAIQRQQEDQNEQQQRLIEDALIVSKRAKEDQERGECRLEADQQKDRNRRLEDAVQEVANLHSEICVWKDSNEVDNEPNKRALQSSRYNVRDLLTRRA